MSPITGTRVVHAEAHTVLSPSGLPTRYLVDATIGSRNLFVAEQSLRPGDRVLAHVHPQDEVLLFLSGSGTATVGGVPMSLAAGITLFVPAGVEHEFGNTGAVPLQVIVVFPGATFAETTLLEPKPPLAPAGGVA